MLTNYHELISLYNEKGSRADGHTKATQLLLAFSDGFSNFGEIFSFPEE